MRIHYQDHWMEVIQNEALWSNPYLANLDYLLSKDGSKFNQSEFSAREEQIFAFPCFMRPGKQYYSVRLDGKKAESPNNIYQGNRSINGSSMRMTPIDDKTSDIDQDWSEYYTHC